MKRYQDGLAIEVMLFLSHAQRASPSERLWPALAIRDLDTRQPSKEPPS